MQGTPASVPQGAATPRQAKSFVGNGLKPFSTGCTLQRLALLDNTLVEFRVYQHP